MISLKISVCLFPFLYSLNKGNIHNGTAGGLLADVSGTSPMINTTSSTNVTITSSGGSVIIKLG